MKLEGRNAVAEALNAGRNIDKILAQNSADVKNLTREAVKMGIKVQYVDKHVLDEQSVTKKHQGIIAFASDYKYSTVEDIVNYAKAKKEDLLVLILDGVEDPHNLGSILRVAECAGAHGVIIPKNRAVPVNETAVKVSAGASERVKVAKVTNLNSTITELKKIGVFVYSADMDGEVMYKTNLKGNIAIVVGGEGTGVSALTRKNSDAIISIPMFGKINSLNASVSAGIVLYEAVRQRIKE